MLALALSATVLAAPAASAATLEADDLAVSNFDAAVAAVDFAASNVEAAELEADDLAVSNFDAAVAAVDFAASNVEAADDFAVTNEDAAEACDRAAKPAAFPKEPAALLRSLATAADLLLSLGDTSAESSPQAFFKNALCLSRYFLGSIMECPALFPLIAATPRCPKSAACLKLL